MPNPIGSLLEDRNLQGDDVEPFNPAGIARLAEAIMAGKCAKPEGAVHPAEPSASPSAEEAQYPLQFEAPKDSPPDESTGGA